MFLIPMTETVPSSALLDRMHTEIANNTMDSVCLFARAMQQNFVSEQQSSATIPTKVSSQRTVSSNMRSTSNAVVFPGACTNTL